MRSITKNLTRLAALLFLSAFCSGLAALTPGDMVWDYYPPYGGSHQLLNSQNLSYAVDVPDWGSADRHVIARNPDGSINHVINPLWLGEGHDYMIARMSLITRDDRIVVQTREDTTTMPKAGMEVFDKTGQHLWSWAWAHGRQGIASLSGLDGRIYVSGSAVENQSSFSALADGVVKWSYQWPAYTQEDNYVYLNSSSMGSNGIIYTIIRHYTEGQYKEEIFGIRDRGSSAVQVMHHVLDEYFSGERIISEHKGVIYVSTDKSVYAISSTGERLWKYSAPDGLPIGSSPVIDLAGNIYFNEQEKCCSASFFRIVSLNSSGGLRWKSSDTAAYTLNNVRGNFTKSSELGPILREDGTILMQTKTRYLVMDTTDGSKTEATYPTWGSVDSNEWREQPVLSDLGVVHGMVWGDYDWIGAQYLGAAGSMKGAWYRFKNNQGDALFSIDDDKDGMDDGWELTHELNVGVDDSAGDLDKDGMANLLEFKQGTLPNDIDGDNVGNNLDWDDDGDGLSDIEEINRFFTDPTVFDLDTDSDGVPDSADFYPSDPARYLEGQLLLDAEYKGTVWKFSDSFIGE